MVISRPLSSTPETTQTTAARTRRKRTTIKNQCAKSDSEAVGKEKCCDVILRNLVLPSSSPQLSLRNALFEQGYSVLPALLSRQECRKSIDLIWEFINDTSSGAVNRSDPTTWYTKNENDPWPSTTETSLFQWNGAGWLFGEMREILAERIFEPLFQTRELHSSKEGFMFRRPTSSSECDHPQELLLGHLLHNCWKSHSLDMEMKMSQDSADFYTIRSLVALEDQVEGVDECFLCYPKASSSDVGQDLDLCLSQRRSPTSDQQLLKLTEQVPRKIHLQAGDVLVWRSDLLLKQLAPSSPTPRFGAVAYISMQPAFLTTPHQQYPIDNLKHPPKEYNLKMEAYRQRQTGDHRANVECWQANRYPSHSLTRPFYRTCPPLVSIRQAELYGLLPYGMTDSTQEHELDRALMRDVRFTNEQLPTQPKTRKSIARLEFLKPNDQTALMGQDKYLGGMSSPCGKYVFGVPGSAKRVLRIHCDSGKMDFIGPEFSGKFKWLRGVDVPASAMVDNEVATNKFISGCCFALPCNSPSVLKINPATDEVYEFGKDVLMECGDVGWLYHGGNLASNGWIYAIPANADRVLKFHPSSDEICFIGPRFVGRQKWYGGIVGSDNCIYGIPHNQRGTHMMKNSGSDRRT